MTGAVRGFVPDGHDGGEGVIESITQVNEVMHQSREKQGNRRQETREEEERKRDRERRERDGYRDGFE